MYRAKALTGVVLALAMLVPVLGAGAEGDADVRETREWTMMVYVGADNDFYENEDGQIADFTLKQLRKALLDPYGTAAADRVDLGDMDVHLVVMVDELLTTGMYLYDIETLSQDPDNLDFDYLPEVSPAEPEMDSSDPETLRWFVDYALENYPAEKNLLFIKNGHAWCGVCPDVDPGEVEVSASALENSMMSISDVSTVLGGFKVGEEGAQENAIDILTFDGDNMASFEAAYELRNSVDYFVGSQQDVPLDGFAYYLTLSGLINDASVTEDIDDVSPRDLSASIVSDFVFYYNNTDGKKVLLPHMLANSQMAVTASSFEMVGESGDNNIKAMADRFMDIIMYMMYGLYPDMDADGEVDDVVTGYVSLNPDAADPAAPDLWDWIPVHRNAIASARDFALIGKIADQAGYEWLPDVQSWVHMLQAYMSVYAADYGWPEDPYFCSLAMKFKEVFNNSRVSMVQCQILDRSGNSDPNGLNIWFPQNWLHWEDLDMTRTRTYAYDGFGARVDIPREYYCVDCPLNYSECGLDFITDYAAAAIEESIHVELWIQFYDIYYDARWLIYSSDTGQDKPQTAR